MKNPFKPAKGIRLGARYLARKATEKAKAESRLLGWLGISEKQAAAMSEREASAIVLNKFGLNARLYFREVEAGQTEKEAIAACEQNLAAQRLLNKHGVEPVPGMFAIEQLHAVIKDGAPVRAERKRVQSEIASVRKQIATTKADIERTDVVLRTLSNELGISYAEFSKLSEKAVEKLTVERLAVKAAEKLEFSGFGGYGDERDLGRNLADEVTGKARILKSFKQQETPDHD